jgi:hypothetical protein
MTMPHVHVALPTPAAVTRIRPTCMMLVATTLLASCVNPVNSDQAGVEQECVYVKVTGSNLPVKECRTAEERAALAAQREEAAQQGLRDLRNLDEFGVAAPGAASLE